MKACPTCGELNGNDRDICYKCGGLLPGPDIEYEKWITHKTAAARKIAKIRTICITSLCVAALALLCLNLIPFQRHINRILNGVMCRLGNLDSSTPITITADGTYKQYLLHWLGKVDTYSGKLAVPGYPETENGYLQVSFYHYSNYIYGSEPAGSLSFGANSVDFTPMNYLIFSNSPDGVLTTTNFYNLGMINCTPSFSRLFIRVYEPAGSDNPSWDLDNGLIICYPASNKSEAVKVAKSFTSGPDSFLTQSGYWMKHPNGE